MNLDDKGSALKLPQPVACPLTILNSLTWKDSSFSVVTIATQALKKVYYSTHSVVLFSLKILT